MTSQSLTALRVLGEVTAYRRAMEKARLLYADRVADRFNPLDFVRLDELGLSRLLGWLLDPKASHAQGGRFLQAFTSMCGDEWTDEDCEKADVALEVTFAGSRIDILVRSRHTLAIENKPWAADQPQQLGRYLAHISGFSSAGHKLVYVTPQGTEPSPGSLAKEATSAALKDGTLILFSYSGTLQDWLDRCRSVCRAPRVGAFIEEIQRSTLALFVGSSDVSDTEAIVKIAVETADSIRSALQIANAQSLIRKTLLEQLRDQLRLLAEREGMTMAWEVSDTKWSGISFDYDASSPFVIRFEFDNAGLNGLAFGLKQRDAKNLADCGPTGNWLRADIGHGGPNGEPYWPWYREASLQEPLFRLPRNIGRDVDVWAEIPSGRVAEHIINAAVTLHASLSRMKSSTPKLA